VDKAESVWKYYVVMVTLGATMMLGARAIEWIVPKPPVEVAVCVYNSNNNFTECKFLSELKQEK
jgi:hypothetical protein